MFTKGKPIQPHLLRSLLAVSTCRREPGISTYSPIPCFAYPKSSLRFAYLRLPQLVKSVGYWSSMRLHSSPILVINPWSAKLYVFSDWPIIKWSSSLMFMKLQAR